MSDEGVTAGLIIAITWTVVAGTLIMEEWPYRTYYGPAPLWILLLVVGAVITHVALRLAAPPRPDWGPAVEFGRDGSMLPYRGR